MPLLVVRTIVVIVSSEHTRLARRGRLDLLGSECTRIVAVNVFPTLPSVLVGVMVKITRLIYSTLITSIYPVISPVPVSKPVTLEASFLVQP